VRSSSSSIVPWTGRPEPAGRTSSAPAARNRHHLRDAGFAQHDRHAVERQQPADLADERVEGLV
jgi:hypothetical protein